MVEDRSGTEEGPVSIPRDRARSSERAALALVSVHPAGAQPPRRSQRAAVMQMIGTTRVDVAYSRPVARGRALFGALVPWGRVWNPGADSATAISVSAPVLVNGARLAAGSYSIW